MSKKYDDMELESERLTDDELENITGGISRPGQYMNMSCPNCGKVFSANVMLDVVKCPSCNKKIELNG